jgi:uncharacterized protein (TIGR03067 family)
VHGPRSISEREKRVPTGFPPSGKETRKQFLYSFQPFKRPTLTEVGRRKDTILVIKDDKYIIKIKDKTYETTFKLDPSKDPKEIDMFFPDGPNAPKVSKGIYRLDGDTFQLCRAQAPGEDRPRDFVTTADSGLFVVVWKRQ